MYLIKVLIQVGGLNMEDFHGAICFIAPAMLYITNETFTKVPAIALQTFCWSTKKSNERTIITRVVVATYWNVIILYRANYTNFLFEFYINKRLSSLSDKLRFN